MQKGDEFRLFVYGINLRVSYYSTNFRVAWVNFNGRVHAIGVGKTFIIAKVNGKELKCLVRVVDINKDQLTLHPGGSYDLDIKGVSDFLKWRSSNPKVASVSWTGRVIAKKKGTTVITAKIKRKIVKCTVVVK
ncbi:MAG TPA: Ig-like domain-containing protein [Mobilitalea sp.]|nr:Ig-like domain-containing protein [Mobilitalea sp.]